MKYKSFRDFLNRKENDDSLSSFANDINIVNLSYTTYAVVNKLFKGTSNNQLSRTLF